MFKTEIAAWHKYGSYLIGVTGIAVKFSDKSFNDFINTCDGNTGGWSIEALRKAWANGSK